MPRKILTILTIISLAALNLPIQARATSTCPDLRFVFVRGSGEAQNISESYQEFRRVFEEKMHYLPSISYDFVDLDYPAISVTSSLGAPIGAALSGGEGYAFGDSVQAGSEALREMVNNTCPNTGFVLGGYSQGAMVISKTLPGLNAEKVIYAATFGDPKLYLPEGENYFHPAACYDGVFSDYRRYVPDCHALEGILGGYRPYEPESFVGKLGTWCNKRDIVCNYRIIGGSLGDHLSYISDGIYEDASRYIFNEIANYFGIENDYISPHDTAILIDSTGSMQSMIEEYKAEALRLANETFAAGGRVALYDYRDLTELYEPRQHCSFETCTPELFAAELDAITTFGGLDEPESFLSATFHVMSELNWRKGSTKSVVAITDAGFHTPDIDNINPGDVAMLSREIDPVNIYVVTTDDHAEEYQEITAATGGSVATSTDSLHLISDEIMDRFDSLPRVEEQSLYDGDFEQPSINIVSVTQTDEHTFEIETTPIQNLIVFLNDAELGVVEGNYFTVTDIDLTKPNTLRIVPFDGTTRGEAKEIQLINSLVDTENNTATEDEPTTQNAAVESAKAMNLMLGIPTVPNTGRR